MADNGTPHRRHGDGRVNPSGVPLSELGPRLRLGLAELLRALDYARAAKRDLWDFAVEIATLRALGLAESDFRWLVCLGYVEHAREVTKLEEDGRQFLPLGELSFSKRTCFILTDRGESAAADAIQRLRGNSLTTAESTGPSRRRPIAMRTRIRRASRVIPWSRKRPTRMPTTRFHLGTRSGTNCA